MNSAEEKSSREQALTLQQMRGLLQASGVDKPTRKIGRNEECPCGSGMKYKKCCLNRF